jgi:maltose alpha-D-glucosyltransferase/alpha-amylase
MRAWLDATHPGVVIVPEGAEPVLGGDAAFHADFALVIHRAHSSLFNNGGAGRFPWYPPTPCYFDAAGEGTPDVFLEAWAERQRSRPGHPLLLASSDHDFSRLVCGGRTDEQLGTALTFLLTWGTVPSIYFGDEIGMRYQPDAPEVEGSICHPGFYNRAGCRTPMQWDGSANAGFSTARADALYLPIDPDPGRPTVEAQRADPHSTLHLVRDLIRLRRAHPVLGTRAPTRVLHTGYPLVYLRGDSHLVAVNPARDAQTVQLREHAGRRAELLLGRGVQIVDGALRTDGFGYAVFELT